MNKKFAYLFPIGGKIVWSGETAEQLLGRSCFKDEAEQAEVAEFCEKSKPGNFIQIEGGEMIVNIS